MASLRARALALLLRLSGRRRRYADPNPDPARFVATRGPEARPTASMRRRLRVSWSIHDGREVCTVVPRGQATGPVVLYLHGGAFIHPITRPHWDFIAGMAERLGATFVVPLYPLAPEHDCKAVSRFSLRLYRHLLDRYGPSGPILMGDSAGGGLALALAMQAVKEGLAQPGALVLLSPWLDLTVSDPAQAAIEPHDVMLMRPGARAAGRWYAGDLPLDDWWVSPLHGELAGLPPVLMFCGTYDILVVDARRLAARARREGADLVYVEEPGLMHVYALMQLPEGRAARARIASFVRETTASSSGDDHGRR